MVVVVLSLFELRMCFFVCFDVLVVVFVIIVCRE